MFGLAYRTDFDLKNHIDKSGVDLRYTDPYTNEKFIPHVIEPTFGLSRLVTIILMNAYVEDLEKQRVVLKLPSNLSPYKVAVFPLVGNKENISTKAKEIFDSLKMQFPTMLDERGNIGKRYYTHDEIGTPFCITIDYQTLEDDTVTIRTRDTAIQQRISISDLSEFLQKSLMKVRRTAKSKLPSSTWTALSINQTVIMVAGKLNSPKKSNQTPPTSIGKRKY